MGSWKTSPISPPRIRRISRLSDANCATSTVSSPRPSWAGRRSRISPLTMRPGRSTIRRIERAVTLFPQPLSPTIPRVRPAWRSKLAPSTALTVPSSAKKYVLRSRTERMGAPLGVRDNVAPPAGSGSDVNAGPSVAVGVGSVAEAVPHEVERDDHDDHRDRRVQQPRRDREGLDVLRLLEEHTPADRGRPESQTQERERRLADDHGRYRERGRRDDVR